MGKVLKALRTADKSEAKKLQQEVNDAVAGTREANLLHAPHSLAYMASILDKGKYWRRCKAFLRPWMDQHLMHAYGAVGIIICFCLISLRLITGVFNHCSVQNVFIRHHIFSKDISFTP